MKLISAIRTLIAIVALLLFASAYADIKVTMHKTEPGAKQGPVIGTIGLKQTDKGVLIEPDLKGLTPGIHGFHIHEVANCSDKGTAAGGHFDPAKTGKHLGPYNDRGHLGDLPVLVVNKDGDATLPLLAPRLKLADFYNHALIIHEGGDNYSDQPEKLGGGGARIACGVIER